MRGRGAPGRYASLGTCYAAAALEGHTCHSRNPSRLAMVEFYQELGTCTSYEHMYCVDRRARLIMNERSHL